MKFKDIKCYDKFKIAQEYDCIFYKETNRHDGSINAYKQYDKNGKWVQEPVHFSSDYEVELTN